MSKTISRLLSGSVLTLSLLSPVLPAAAATPNPTTVLTLAHPVHSCVKGKPQIKLTWSRVLDAKTYIIERKLATRQTWEEISQELFVNASYVDTKFTRAQSYNYRIRAKTADGTITSNSAIAKVLKCLPSMGFKKTVSRVGISKATKELVPPTKPVMWGVYAGYGETDLPDFEAKIGKTARLAAAYVSWGNENGFPAVLASQSKRKTLVIFWDPWDYNIASANQPRFSYKAILNGDWDEYITSFAASAKAHHEPIILVPFRSMNVDWNVWSGTANGNTTEEHKKAYQYLHSFFTDVPNVKFGWSVNNVSYPAGGLNTPADYYPGDEYVDYVGVDGFNTGEPWMPFDNIYNITINALRKFRKPIMIFTMSAADDPRKAQWIRDALTVQMKYYPEIVGWIWYNEKTDKDWRVWSNEEALKAFQEAVK